jgi:hypothetical protein
MVMMSALIVNNTRQSPERNRIPVVPFSAFTSPTPVAANVFILRDLTADIWGQFAPLANGGGRELDLLHAASSHNAIAETSPAIA